jgi:glycerol-3-phosphate acyltransferase PlsY
MEHIWNIFLPLILSYLLGSIPTSFLLVKSHYGIDIRNSGSGNVGAFNSLQVSNSKLIGIIVLIFDLFKAVIAIFIVYFLISQSYLSITISSIFVVLGHNYSIWISFKGGRGLASAAGLFILLNPIGLIHWLISWLIAYKFIKKDITFANIFASILSVILVFRTPDFIFYDYKYAMIQSPFYYQMLYLSINILILLAHRNEFKSQFEQFKN